MITLYNAGDILGKYAPSIKFLMKEGLFYGVLIFKFVFFIMFILIAYKYKDPFI